MSLRIDEVAERYETELDLIIELAGTETSLRRLGDEIQMNRRRVNARTGSYPRIKEAGQIH